MLLGIDHLVIAVADPDAAAADLEAAVGLVATGGGRHERMGTRNRLVWLGDTYLELIGVWDRDLAAASWVGAPTLRALATIGESTGEATGALATWALASDDLAGDVGRLRAAGADWSGPAPGERTRPDGRVVRWAIASPPALGPGQPPFLIEHDVVAAEWTPAERTERASLVHPLGGPVRLATLELPAAPGAVAGRSMALLRAVGLRFRPSLAGRGARDADVGPQRVRLAPAPEGSPPVVHLRVVTEGPASSDAPPAPAVPRTVDALGLRFAIGA